MPRNPALDPSYYHGDSPVRAVSAPEPAQEAPADAETTEDTPKAEKKPTRRRRAG